MLQPRVPWSLLLAGLLSSGGQKVFGQICCTWIHADRNVRLANRETTSHHHEERRFR